MRPPPSREDVIVAVRAAVERESWAIACWEGGAASFGRVDPWSDVDVGVAVEDGRIAEAFERVEGALSALAPVDWSWEEAPVTAPKPARYYHLQGTDPFLIVDIVVVPASTPPCDRYVDERRHGRARVLFDRTGFTSVPSAPEGEWRARLRRRLPHLVGRFRLGRSLVEKAVRRGEVLEAQAYYFSYTLGPLVEALRVRHDPWRHDYGVRYLRFDLPPEVRLRLEGLAAVPDGAALLALRESAEAWFETTIADLDVDGLALG